MPHPAIAPWVNDFIEEAAIFPNGRNDDWVDMTSQLLNRWQNHSFGALYRHVMTADIYYDDATRPAQRQRPENWVVIYVTPTGRKSMPNFWTTVKSCSWTANTIGTLVAKAGKRAIWNMRMI